ncbi:MAG: hypothetical protein CFE34_02415 [Rhodobacteraceae bacterium PARR1]|nr:MAG: hypothetical protein CFE34_02415 [Rhodobacteraceae bacterium PARR1]
MLFADDPGGTPLPDPLPADVRADDLLATCAAEAARQAQALHRLDAALGQTLAMVRAAAGQADAGLVSALTADLQQADQLRQEAEGLAQALALLASLPRRPHLLTADQVRACTPIVALQRRLLSGGQERDCATFGSD